MASKDKPRRTKSEPATGDAIIAAARTLCEAVDTLRFRPPVAYVYNPLIYAWRAHEIYLRKYANSPKRVVFLGMNPGPFGMAQTGVPFGQIAAVRDWMKIESAIVSPPHQHPKRPITGFDCARSEVSGERLWNLFARRFGAAEKFFAEHFVANYCPLAFVEESGRNRTPDKLPPDERDRLFHACDQHLRATVEILQPEFLIGIGDFAFGRAATVFTNRPRLGRILHPSPASPAANVDWAKRAIDQLVELKIWSA